MIVVTGWLVYIHYVELYKHGMQQAWKQRGHGHLDCLSLYYFAGTVSCLGPWELAPAAPPVSVPDQGTENQFPSAQHSYPSKVAFIWAILPQPLIYVLYWPAISHRLNHWRYQWSSLLLAVYNITYDYDRVLGPNMKKENIFAVTRLKSTRRL